MALVTRNVLRGGLGAGLRTSAGILSGLCVWAVLAAFGVAAVVAASATAFTVLKLAGAAYLIFLGVTTIWRTRRGAAAPADAPARGLSFGGLYRQGLHSMAGEPPPFQSTRRWIRARLEHAHSPLVVIDRIEDCSSS